MHSNKVNNVTKFYVHATYGSIFIHGHSHKAHTALHALAHILNTWFEREQFFCLQTDHVFCEESCDLKPAKLVYELYNESYPTRLVHVLTRIKHIDFNSWC